MRAAVVVMLSAALVLPGAARAGDKDKAKGNGSRPRLDMRVSPRFAFSPAEVMVTAELLGGTAIEEFHCPELEWDWDDGSKSVQEPDCDPLEADGDIERRFTAHHVFSLAANYSVKLTLRKGEKVLATQTVKVTVRPGAGDPTLETP